jgi:hypothetical protein
MAKNVAKGSRASDPAPTQTPEEFAANLANEYLALIANKKELEAKIEEVKAKLEEFARSTGNNDLEVLTVTFGMGKPKFDFGNLTKKSQEQLIERLKNELPDFVTKSTALDLEALYLAKETNTTVANALKAHGLKLVPSETVSIRAKK